MHVYDERASPSPLLNTAIVSEYAMFMQVATFSRSFRVKCVRYTSLLLCASSSLSPPHLILLHGFSTLSFDCDGKTGGIELGRDHAKQKKNWVLWERSQIQGSHMTASAKSVEMRTMEGGDSGMAVGMLPLLITRRDPRRIDMKIG